MRTGTNKKAAKPRPAARPRRRAWRERRREAVRADILAAASRVIAREGFGGTTIGDVAREAGLAVGTLYNFYRNKQALYVQVLGHLFNEVRSAMTAVLDADLPPEQAVLALIDLRLRHFETHREVLRFFIEMPPHGRASMARSLPDNPRAWFPRYIERVADIFRRGVDAGLFRSADPLHLSLALEGYIMSFVRYWTIKESTTPLAGEVAGAGAAFLEMIRADATAREARA